MKKFKQLFIIALVAGVLFSCSQTSKNAIEGSWRVDSLDAVNLKEYATFMTERDLENFDMRVAQLQSILDTIKNPEQKAQLESSLEEMQAQKGEINAENYEKRIKEQNAQTQGNFSMLFAADSAFYIINKANDTIQKGTWEKTEDKIITSLQQAGATDTFEISRLENDEMVLMQHQKFTEDFTLDIKFHMSKKEGKEAKEAGEAEEAEEAEETEAPVE